MWLSETNRGALPDLLTAAAFCTPAAGGYILDRGSQFSEDKEGKRFAKWIGLFLNGVYALNHRIFSVP